MLTSATPTTMYVWDKSLATGIPEIDEQHQQILNQLNALREAMKRGQGRAELQGLFDFLDKYTRMHFAHEEGCMAQRRCPAAEMNKGQHALFVAKVTRLRADFDRSGPTAELVLFMQRELIDWIVNHIRRTDATLRECVHGEGV